MVTNRAVHDTSLTTFLVCEVRITSKRDRDDLVTLVGAAINCDKLNDSQKLVKDFDSLHSVRRRLQFKSPIMYTGLSSDNA